MDGFPEIKKKGDTVEGYRVLSEIGRGAASIIYLVQDEKKKTIWALKHVQKNDVKEQRFLDQAEIEYQISQQLGHPVIRAIPRLIKKGSLLKTKELFLVMELVDGQSMERHPPSTFEEAIEIFMQVAQGLHHMHERGFVHADMKPNNIVVSDGGVAKVIDLGQSCKIGTIKPRIQGTPDYIAPEQVHRREITPLTDVYNLGATMYWVLTRKNIPTALGKGDRLLGSVDDSLLEKPKPARELNPRIPELLDEIIMQCVEVTPESRPSSMQKVNDRLELVLGKLIALQQQSPGDASKGQPSAGHGVAEA
ncbi:MAG: serine/threonine-protein kinase [Planctomycetota bacterium]